jgi:extradiol dioxygenase family protein
MSKSFKLALFPTFLKQSYSTPSLQPFHLAFPVSDLEKARHFYGNLLGCSLGRESPGHWIDFNLFGHQIVAHQVKTPIVILL